MIRKQSRPGGAIPRERLSPCLLDRLLAAEGVLPTRREPSFQVEETRSNAERLERITQPFLYPDQYESSVCCDLDWLVRTRCFSENLRLVPIEDACSVLSSLAPMVARSLDEFPEVRKSVLCYGVPDLTGEPDVDTRQLRDLLEDAIRAFEPRIDPDTLDVELIDKRADAGSDDLAHQKAAGIFNSVFRISGELWADPWIGVGFSARFDPFSGTRIDQD